MIDSFTKKFTKRQGQIFDGLVFEAMNEAPNKRDLKIGGACKRVDGLLMGRGVGYKEGCGYASRNTLKAVIAEECLVAIAAKATMRKKAFQKEVYNGTYTS